LPWPVHNRQYPSHLHALAGIPSRALKCAFRQNCVSPALNAKFVEKMVSAVDLLENKHYKMINQK
jgi:hypothetical protein